MLIRHYFNTRHDSNKYAWTLPVGALAMICLACVTGPKPMAVSPEQAAAKIEYQPLPATAVGGKTAAEQRAEDAAKAAAAEAPAQATAQAGAGDFDKIHNVIQERCTVCHSAKPTSPLFSAAPAGVMFDTRSRSRPRPRAFRRRQWPARSCRWATSPDDHRGAQAGR